MVTTFHGYARIVRSLNPIQHIVEYFPLVSWYIMNNNEISRRALLEVHNGIIHSIRVLKRGRNAIRGLKICHPCVVDIFLIRFRTVLPTWLDGRGHLFVPTEIDDHLGTGSASPPAM